MEIKAVRGMHDLEGAELHRWTVVETRVKKALASFGYSEIRTPVLETLEVFTKSVGDQTDIVEKQMYLVDKGEEKLALRPEGTSGFIRAVVEHGLHRSGQPLRHFYYLPMFRHERPQKGRLRQFHQFGAELINDSSPEADAELIVLLDSIYKGFGLTNYQIEINSLGSAESRGRYRDALQAFFKPRLAELCPQCQARFERAPLRILDCKNESCQAIAAKAPLMIDFLSPEDGAHFQALQKNLTACGTAHVVNPRIVRGLDYYCRTAFEFQSSALGAQSALGGGGRYDGLSTRFGVPAFPAVGWGIGMERLLIALEESGFDFGAVPGPAAYLAPLGDAAFDKLFPLSMSLKRQGVRAEMNYSRGKKLNFYLKDADRSGARFLVMVGDNELAGGKAVLKDLSARTQVEIALADTEIELLKRLT
jgi:histidyl-tRNA synthetase